jgi:enoyl-CoA hydratase/carnithine racemase
VASRTDCLISQHQVFVLDDELEVFIVNGGHAQDANRLWMNRITRGASIGFCWCQRCTRRRSDATSVSDLPWVSACQTAAWSAYGATATEGATLGVVTRLSNDPVAEALAAAAEIAGRSPSAVRGAKQLINRLSNAGAADHFAAEREIIFKLIGSANQVEAITANFENRAPKFDHVKD